MTTELSVKNNWNSIDELLDKQNQFRLAIQFIKSLDPSNDLNLWVKWKNYNNQVVIKTPEYYYKVYVSDIEHGMFSSIIREELGKIYREDFGLIWNVTRVIDNSVMYIIEQREPIQHVDDSIINYEHLLLNWGRTLLKLEERIGLPYVLKQIKEVFPNVEQLKLIRDCYSKYNDYGLIDGKIVLFDDADWFLCLVDKNGNRIIDKNQYIDVTLKTGEFKFSNVHCNPWSMPIRVDELCGEWWLYFPTQGSDKSIIDFRNDRQVMIDSSIKLLSSMEELPYNEKQNILPIKKQPELLGVSYER